MDKEMESEDVLGKREAALRWANYVTAMRRSAPSGATSSCRD